MGKYFNLKIDNMNPIQNSFSCKILIICLIFCLLNQNVKAQNQSSDNTQWFLDSYRKLFFDYHTYEAARDVALHFDSEKWAEQLENSLVQAVSLHTVCNKGWRYYRKGNIGYVHPKLPDGLDMVEEILNSCHKRGIKVIAYFNVMATETALKYHPDWILTRENGEQSNIVSLFSGYFEEMLLPQLEEFNTYYKVDGIFFDFLWVANPDDVHAKKKFCDVTGDEYPKSEESLSWPKYIKWLLSEGERLRNEAIEAIHVGNTETLVGINWSYNYRQPEVPPENLGFLTLDIMPNDQVNEGSFIAKNWATLDKPFDIMTTAFLGWWGDWGVKPAETMKQECATVMANGGRTWIGYQIRPEFEVEPALMNEFRKTFQFVKERENICYGADVIPYIAILHSKANHFTEGYRLTLGGQSLRGAHKMLMESGFHFNILDEETLFDNLDKYQLVILPDQRYINSELSDALKKFVNNGGSIIGTQLTSTLDENFKFTGNYLLSDLFGIDYRGKYNHDHSFIEIKNEVLKPDVLCIPQQAFGECVLIKETTAEVLANLWEPLMMEDGRYIHESSPPGKYSGSPAITVNKYGKGKAVFLSNDIFGAYYLRPQWNLKNIFRNLLNEVIPEKLIEIHGPGNVEVVLAEKDGAKQVHLVNHYRDKTIGDSYSIAENVLPVYDIKIKIKAEQVPGSVVLIPERENLNFKYENGYVSFTIPKLHIYTIAVIK
jgi:hypothetical protein